MNSLFLTLAEVAELLRRRTKSVANAVNPRTNRLQFSDGTGMPTVKIGRARLIPIAAFEQFLRERGLALTPPSSTPPPDPAAHGMDTAAAPKRRGRPRSQTSRCGPGGR